MAALPSVSQPFFRDSNLREGFVFDAPSKPAGMKRDAAGLRLSRYGKL